MAVIELSIVLLLALTVVLRARLPGGREWLHDAPLIFAASFLGEDSCIRLYGFYGYAPGWHLFLDRTPLFIPTIWIFVVLSARDVARLLSPRHATLLAFFLVWFDASLIEPIATTAGLWTWSEQGPFGVPLVGILGWAHFGVAALFCLERLPRRLRLLTVVLAPLGCHALLLASWWGLYRWLPRGSTGWTPALVALAIGIGLAVLLVRTGRAGALPLKTLVPRVAPALFFFALLAASGGPKELWVYSVPFALPWLTAIRFSPAPSSAAAPGT